MACYVLLVLVNFTYILQGYFTGTGVIMKIMQKNHVHFLCFVGLVQDCSVSSASAMEILQSCTKLSICDVFSSLIG